LYILSLIKVPIEIHFIFTWGNCFFALWPKKKKKEKIGILFLMKSWIKKIGYTFETKKNRKRKKKKKNHSRLVSIEIFYTRKVGCDLPRYIP